MNRVGNRQRCCFEIFGFDIMLDESLKPWVLEVNCLPSLSSSSIFDKQVKTQLICDAFTTVGFLGYNKRALRKKQNTNLDEARIESSPPNYDMSFEIEQLEEFGGCQMYEPMEESESLPVIQEDLAKPVIAQSYDHIQPAKPKGPGLPKNSVLSKDELTVVLDLEEETARRGEFARIFPLRDTAAQYYGFMEERRYFNALYCAWLATDGARKQ